MKTHKNHLRLLILLLLVLLACASYMTVGVHFENQKLFAYAMRIRTPKLIAMLITAFAIGSASIVFQSIINNTIVTPCLLGMDQLYSLIHTAVFFVAGSGSFLAVNANAAFAVDLAIMGAVATVIYSYLFRKTNHNVLYVLLIGTVLTSFFSSIQTTLTRVMDPNEYDTLLTDLVASFSNVNSAILVLSVAVLALVAFAFRKELALLDVLTLGKDQTINLGVDYDRCIRRLLLGYAMIFTLPGVPCLYYGDEIAMQGYRDPFNRAFFRWDAHEQRLRPVLAQLAQLRHTCEAFRTGELRVLRAEGGVLHYQRIGEFEAAEIIVNRTEHIIVEPLASGKHTEVNPMGFTIVVEEVGHNPNHSYYDYI